MKMKIQPIRIIAQAVLRGKFIAMSTYAKQTNKQQPSPSKNPERSQIYSLIMHLEVLEKQVQAKPQISRQKEIIKIKAEISDIETSQRNYTKNQ
jgi:hypothetical protein